MSNTAPRYTVILANSAEESIADQIEYLAGTLHHSIDSAYSAVLAVVDKVHANLAFFPAAAPVSPEASEIGVTHYRRLLIDGFRIFYEIDEQLAQVHVLLMLKCKQDVKDALIRYCLIRPDN
ncbi:type II toxin-antitoxin system RelE/ParE family toxin [Pseudomonas sp. TE3610]